STSLHQLQKVQMFRGGGCEPLDQNGGSTDSPGANRNATRRRRGPGGREPRMAESPEGRVSWTRRVIHLPPPPCSGAKNSAREHRRCGSSSMVEPQPSKLMVRVRF